ncbi:MAG: hypothetical protein K1X78_24210 [Verrucomicrobiaceae bacterium]|nr:hypothetical protein [Verrucomicrobiaceae bacterium]
MQCRTHLAAALSIAAVAGGEEKPSPAFDYKAPPHSYWEREPQDVFSKLLKKMAAGEVKLDTTDEKSFARSVLAALDVPVSSQILVYSATSMQSERINARNPRALYFNEDAYVGVVPGGLVEVLSIDPELGGVFHVFNYPRPGVPPQVDRPTKCFNCHATNATQRLPGLIAESVAPLPNGGSYESYRGKEQGHQIPIADRFGGWHVTSAKPFGPSHEGAYAQTGTGGVRVIRIKPGEMSDLGKHLTRTSDILAHLIHEHQLGFDNRVIQASYLAREVEAHGAARSAEDEARLDDKAREVVRYVLFADEAKLPAGGITGDAQFIKDFSRNRRPVKSGAALKDLDLRTRMFKNRCSYMIYTPQWQKMPEIIKSRIYAGMKAALSGKDRAYAYLADEERRNIVTILRETLPDLPADWR